MFELLIENNKHANFEWRGQGRGADSFVFWSYPIWVQCLNNFVADLGFRKKEMHSFPRGALSKSQNWPAGPVIFDNEIAFFKESFLKNHLLPAYYLGFDWSGWIVLIKSEILVTTRMVWLVSSDKWKARFSKTRFINKNYRGFYFLNYFCAKTQCFELSLA